MEAENARLKASAGSYIFTCTNLGPDLFALYAEANGLTLQQAIERLAQLAGLLPAEAADGSKTKP